MVEQDITEKTGCVEDLCVFMHIQILIKEAYDQNGRLLKI
jgi:hypothetical protein